MVQVQKFCVLSSLPLSAAVKELDINGGQIVLVIDSESRLVGTITDGDVRRALLKGISLEAPIHRAMNANPHTVPVGTPLGQSRDILMSAGILQLPVLDGEGRPVDLIFAEREIRRRVEGHHIVIMAGGLGTRLMPITETVPKPMITLGGRPILERILENFRAQGFKSVTLCVNHLAHVIEDYFGDGSGFGLEIDYVREPKRLGTAGALSLLTRHQEEPFIVMNGDILTSVNFSRLLTFHRDSGALATMCVNQFGYQSPYGVVELDGFQIARLVEKPKYEFFINAGIYVIDPRLLLNIPRNEYFDMPSLFDRIEKEMKIAFPIHEYWLDIGRPDDLAVARLENSLEPKI